MSSRKPHFSYDPLGDLRWTQFKEHQYELRPQHGTLKLQATVETLALGGASTLDHFIWDEIVKKEASTWCDSLTIWTKDIEFNVLLFGKDHSLRKVRCAYFATPESEMCKEHLAYWGLISKKTTGIGTHAKQPCRTLYEAINHAGVAIHKKKTGQRIQEVIHTDDCALVKRLLPQIVVWNRYKNVLKKNGKASPQFRRNQAITLDAFRMELQTIPVPTAFLEQNKPLVHIVDCKEAATSLYNLILSRFETVTGCGSPMKRNLHTLASLLADTNIRVALVTGEPGTGKENLSKAIYYGNKLRQPAETESENIFLQTTAVEIQAAMAAPHPKTPSQFLREKLATKRSNSPVIFIDELNKANQEFLAAMLRPLEQGETELGTTGHPKYILAASRHIDELAKQPPQDFWTRVSHQLRVVHPLSHVSEADGEAFLTSFFFAQWWSFIEVMVRDYADKKHADGLIKLFLGQIDPNKGTFKQSYLCMLARRVFVNSLVPLVSRDTLSVRGARSILSQAFARVSWLVRFQKPTWDINVDDDADEVGRLVNSAIQDVMAILNPARATPAALEDRRSNRDEKK